MVYSPVACMRVSSACCRAVSFGFLPLSLPLARATAIPSRVLSLSRSTSNSAKVGQDVEEHLPEGVRGIVDSAAEGELYAAGDQRVPNLAGVKHRPGEPVELGDDEGVAGPDGSQGLVQTGAGTAGSSEALVEVDPVVRHAERDQGLTLGSEILQDGGAPGIADEFSHPGSVPFNPCSPDH
jgi:hypothetical protein